MAAQQTVELLKAHPMIPLREHSIPASIASPHQATTTFHFKPSAILFQKPRTRNGSGLFWYLQGKESQRLAVFISWVSEPKLINGEGAVTPF